MHSVLHSQACVAYSLLAMSMVVSIGSFHMSSGMLPLSLLLVARRLTTLLFSMPIGIVPVSWLSCRAGQARGM